MSGQNVSGQYVTQGKTSQGRMSPNQFQAFAKTNTIEPGIKSLNSTSKYHQVLIQYSIEWLFWENGFISIDGSSEDKHVGF